MTWSDESARRAELPADWPKIREKRLKMDGHRCTWRLKSGARCPRVATDVDHRDQSRNDDHSLGNLQSLCAHHHGKKSAIEGVAARRRRRRGPSRRRQPEAHPGIRPAPSRVQR